MPIAPITTRSSGGEMVHLQETLNKVPDPPPANHIHRQQRFATKSWKPVSTDMHGSINSEHKR
ncbi:predicted protein [Plenodomus lingam JN3]|uniref:Predicted protein n=1 Tax=Leptosphaeria maculans (strain JN3 / isolate v23.1.3 / race Av1-4-5-6-7-8) TaxID=985895 RepID=E4ZN33_LEPMJ|nr:predicted protein [Plenodomus lingam JN3]CBX92636.1 predicted protein [Plenodomus lingam JN3]